MKQKLNFLSILVLSAVIFTSCATSKVEKTEETKVIPHPRTYTIDPFDKAKTLKLTYNKYNPGYEGSIDFWSYLKKDKPQAGDTIKIRGKFKSNVDIPCIVYYLSDDSSLAKYGTTLSSDNAIVDVKAGTSYELKADLVIGENTKGSLVLTFIYDCDNHNLSSFDKIGKEARFTFEKVEDTTDTIAENPTDTLEERKPKTFNIQLDKCAPFFEIATNYPLVNGKLDMSVVSNYQTILNVATAFDDELPKAGDTINITWSAKTDVRLTQVYIRPIDFIPATKKWTEIVDIDWDNTSQYIIAKGVKPGEPFIGTISFKLTKNVTNQLSVCVWYEVGDASPEGPALCKLAKHNSK